MARHNELGREGETQASLYLLLRGYHILGRNWLGDNCEIDIIAEYYGEIVFIEVKTRTEHEGVLPEEAVDANRMYRMSRAAEEYLAMTRRQDSPFRFDIMAVTARTDEWVIRHLKYAFGLKPKKPHYSF